MKTTTLTALTALTLVFAFYTGCSPQKTTPANLNQTETSQTSNIIGGVEATADFQNQNGLVGIIIVIRESSLELDKTGHLVPKVVQYTALCSGSLIDRKIILTAAHCLMTDSPAQRIVAILAYFKTDANTLVSNDIFPVESVAVNPDFMKNVDPKNVVESVWDDLALLKLKDEAPAAVQTVKRLAPTDNVTIDNSTKLILAGYGMATPFVRKEVLDPKTGKTVVEDVVEEIDTTGILRLVEDVPVLSVTADNKEIKLDESVKGSCHGDSGGPAFLKQADGSLVQVGLTSRGTDKLGNCVSEGIYTNITAHYDWIKTASDALLNPPPAPTTPAAPTAPAHP